MFTYRIFHNALNGVYDIINTVTGVLANCCFIMNSKYLYMIIYDYKNFYDGINNCWKLIRQSDTFIISLSTMYQLLWTIPVPTSNTSSSH